MKRILSIGLGIGIFLSSLILVAAPTIREWGFIFVPKPNVHEEYKALDVNSLKKNAAKLEREIFGLLRKYDRLYPDSPYLIIDTSDNQFQLMSSRKKLREGVCSTGSYTLLKTADKREWIFKTPRGMFRVQGKLEAPIWKKPDWAFIEDGLPVPTQNARERFEAGVLGEYALSIGDGYLIHGTLYKRFLGIPVTHGCVRLDDEDLKNVYENLQIGSRVFIY